MIVNNELVLARVPFFLFPTPRRLLLVIPIQQIKVCDFCNIFLVHNIMSETMRHKNHTLDTNLSNITPLSGENWLANLKKHKKNRKNYN